MRSEIWCAWGQGMVRKRRGDRREKLGADAGAQTYEAVYNGVNRRAVVAEPCIRDADNAVAFAGGDGGRHREKEEKRQEAHCEETWRRF